MIRFLVRRLVLAVPTVVGVSFVVFLTAKLVPGDPVASLLGPLATPLARAELVAHLGLDRPWPVQFVTWLGNALRGDLGMAIHEPRAVAEIVASSFGDTALLALAGGLIALVGGVVLGVLGAMYPKRLPGRLTSGLSVVAMSAPQYSVALLLVIVFAVHLRVLPAGGMTDPIDGGGLADLLVHMVLPAVSVALIPLGVIARMFRSALTEVLGSPFVEAMRARGIGPVRIARHAAHNALPALFTITGLQLAYLIGGVVFVETIFSWPGIGLTLYNAISTRDLPLIQGGVLVVAVSFVLINILVDAAHALVDPRVRR
ncbi:ABC transporter permease [Pseudonocardia thermophila]|uniref:ABC transporter permease n=1 Tax=Pseudonocardia thermophila TaxID=1848 RepID=UPI00248F1F72|nr:ABC transporter permease [Pseudonocardia thermophila]